MDQASVEEVLATRTEESMSRAPDAQKPTIDAKAKAALKSLITKKGWLGDYDYVFLFKPNLPFMKKDPRPRPFYGLNDDMPILLGLLLGLQHALAMLAGIVTPPILMSGVTGVNLGTADTQYLVSTALIVTAILSTVQITRIKIPMSSYYLGTGLLSVVGTSFDTIPVASGVFDQMYKTGYCKTDTSGNRLPCPKGYGALLGTTMVTALLEMLISFVPPRYLRKVFPPLVTGPTVMLIGVALVQSGFQSWAGGAGPCMSHPASGPFQLCPSVSAPHPLPWGSAEFIGLGFSAFITIILCERFGSPMMRSCSIVLGLLVGSIIAAATGYFSAAGIDAAPAVSFIWVKTYPLSVYGPAVLPCLALYVVILMEAIGDITATCDVSKLAVSGKGFDSRVQGGVLADGLNGLLAGLCTITPMSVFAQNNGVIALTNCANRTAGYFACFWLLIFGIFAKIAAALVSIPDPVLGGVTTFLFASVAVSGIRVVSTIEFTPRNRFILACSLAPGLGAILVPNWFSFFFTYQGGGAKGGLLSAVQVVMETGFAVTGFVAVILNLVIPGDRPDESGVAHEEHAMGLPKTVKAS
ncbi:purine permease [Akanthomyces lecanii RCEF 1005]|uniref:Purine permease n=1 Tax=Akanthomyces lecanii RCEF 1005 TaxID=1081108 RepID=A0A168JJ41_CORDF|nr:purine permease [Akanthomyces lecanii RCEF 1005]